MVSLGSGDEGLHMRSVIRGPPHRCQQPAVCPAPEDTTPGRLDPVPSGEGYLPRLGVGYSGTEGSTPGWRSAIWTGVTSMYALARPRAPPHGIGE
jgi:hypothetical protein